MKKIAALTLALALLMGAAVAEGIGGSYTIHVTGDDWGCGVAHVTLTLTEPVEGLNAENLLVTENKTALDWSTFTTGPVSVARNVLSVTPCDEQGNAVEGASQYYAIELNIDPNEGSPLFYNYPYNVWDDTYGLSFALSEGASVTRADGSAVDALSIDAAYSAMTTDVDAFTYDTYEATDINGNAITYNYATYTPATESKTLFVWLHGMGEGGSGLPDYPTDARIPLLAAEGSALISDAFQGLFGGCHILAPQSPTMWMDGGSGDVDGKEYSIYTESLHELINMYRDKIDAEKVIIGGCSNGGYMTMVLAKNYGAEYTAYVPICEALADELITDEQIAEMAKLPMFFIYSQDDTTVVPETYEIPTIARLKAAGAENLHVFAPEHVYDTTGRFTDTAIDSTNPESVGMYMGHWSWVYFFNNEAVCDEDGTNCWEWMAAQ